MPDGSARRSWISGFLQAIGECSLRTGEWATALDELEEALLDDWAGPDRMSLLGVTGALSALRGRDQASRIREIEGLMEPGFSESFLATGPNVIGYAAFASGRLAEAADALAKCAEVYWANLPSSISVRAHSALWLGDARGRGPSAGRPR